VLISLLRKTPSPKPPFPRAVFLTYKELLLDKGFAKTTAVSEKSPAQEPEAERTAL
jgi:hypothetical protein